MTGPHRLLQGMDLECEVLIIGSGAGGAVVADVLTRAGIDVLMLEEGPYIPQSKAPNSAVEAFPKLWRSGGVTAALGPQPVAYAEGRCVGGGTEINSAIFQRTPAELLEDWAKRYQIAEFGADQLADYFERAAATVNASQTSGPLGEHSETLRRGGEALGWKVSALERGQRSCVGTNLCALSCPTGGKQSMTATLIPEALRRGLRLIAECRVLRLNRKSGRITGATAIVRDDAGRRGKVTVRCKEVFLCAGAIHSPALLKRSGLGTNVGKSLRLHPTVKAIGVFDDPIEGHLSRLPLYAVTEFMPDQRIGGSVFTPGFFGMALAEDWAQRADLMKSWRNCASYYAMARAEGTGSIRPLPGVGDPLVTYRLTDADRRNLASGLGRLGRLMFAAGARRVFPSITGHAGWDSPKDCEQLESDQVLPWERTNIMTIHLFSSCPPGENRALSATDSFGRVRGAENVTLADASQIPEAPGVNPQGTVMALAYRAAEAFLTRSGREIRRESFEERCVA